MVAQTRKFGSPLYCCAWIASACDENLQTFVVGGGGGKGAHGIQNRLVVAQYSQKNGLSDEVSSCSTGKHTPQRMAAHPDGDNLIVAMEDGCALFRIEQDRGLPLSHRSVQVLLAEEGTLCMSSLPSNVKCMKFSDSGNKLVMGCEDGSVYLYSWPDLRVELKETGKRSLHDSVTGIDISSDEDMILATCYDGNCYIWNLLKEKIFKLQSSYIGLSKFRGCAFSPDGKKVIVGRNYSGAASLSRFAMDSWELDRDACIFRGQAITVLEASPDRMSILVGSSEGEVAVVQSETLGVCSRTRGVHMVFVTAAAISKTGKLAITVSADASASCRKVCSSSRWAISLQGFFKMLTLATFLYYVFLCL